MKTEMKPGDVIYWRDGNDILSDTVESVGVISGRMVYITETTGERVYPSQVCDENGEDLLTPDE